MDRQFLIMKIISLIRILCDIDFANLHWLEFYSMVGYVGNVGIHIYNRKICCNTVFPDRHTVEDILSCEKRLNLFFTRIFFDVIIALLL